MIWIALLPTRMPRKMKIVNGFHGFEVALAVVGEDEERRDLGRREVQKVAWAILGRLDSCASWMRVVAEKGRDRS